MNTKEKILELVNQLDDEKQLQILEELKQILEPELNPILKDKLSRRVDNAEEDIKLGRVFTRAQVEQRINKKLGL